MPRLRPSTIPEWPVPFDPGLELDWGRPEYGRRLLGEHLDQSHEGASRPRRTVAAHVRRLRTLLPAPPARVLDAGCGPGLYAVALARSGHDVTGIDVNAAALRHARSLAAREGARAGTRFTRTSLEALAVPAPRYDAALLLYFLLEAFPRERQVQVLRRLAAAVIPGGTLIAELRQRPDQLPGRIPWWDVVPRSILSDRRHLLVGDTTYDARRHTYVLRELAIFDDGRVAAQQTSGWLCPYDRVPALFRRGGFSVERVFDGWSPDPGSQLSDTLLVVARRRP